VYPLRDHILTVRQHVVTITRNSSGDDIANVNFFYDDIVHCLQNTIDWRIHSETGRHSTLFVARQLKTVHDFNFRWAKPLSTFA